MVRRRGSAEARDQRVPVATVWFHSRATAGTNCRVTRPKVGGRQWLSICKVLPAVGYDDAQLAALGRTINSSDADVVVSATPCDLAALVDIAKPVVRARYRYAETVEPGLAGIVEAFVSRAQVRAVTRS